MQLDIQPQQQSNDADAPPVPPLRRRRITLGHVPLQMLSPAKPHRILEQALTDGARREQIAREDLAFPYWVEIWPAAVGLGRYLVRRNLDGVRAIELGAGVGLAGLAAAHAGAQVLLTDHEEAALRIAVRNAALNDLRVETATFDWHTPSPRSTFDLVLGADVLYEKDCIAPIARVVGELLAPGGQALIADPGRSYVGLFEEALAGLGLTCQRRATHFYWDGRSRTVLLLHVRRRST